MSSKPIVAFFRPNQKVVDSNHMLEWLRTLKPGVCGIAPEGNGVSISCEKGTADPTPLLDQYTNPDYYKVECLEAKCLKESWFVGCCYDHVCVELGAPFTIKVTKRKGVDDSILPDNDTLDIHWHGAPVSAPKTLTLVNGVGQFTIAKPKHSRTIVEAVPTGSVDLENHLAGLRRGGIYLHAGNF